MATLAEPLLMTVDQYRELPHRDDVIQELHYGQLVTLSFPKAGHKKLQERLVTLLRPHARGIAEVISELPFRALPEYDLRGADIGVLSKERWDAVPDDEDLYGSPELVIEVLSPSNTRAEMREKASLCLATGAEEFWVVDPKRKQVSVTARGRNTLIYGPGDRIPLTRLGGELIVDEIFAGS